MEHRTMEVNLISAKDLNKVNLISKMNVYAVVSIEGAGDSARQKTKTPVSRDDDTDPSWNYPMKFTVDEGLARQSRLTLVFNLRCERALGDKDIGEVHVPLKEVLETYGTADGKPQFVSYQVRKPSGKAKGQLNFSYKFGEKASVQKTVKADHAPATAYPAPVGTSTPYPAPGAYPTPATPAGAYPPPKDNGWSGYAPPPPTGYPAPAAASSGGYPPPPTGYGYGYPAPQPYGGYPPPGGYGYPPQSGYGYPQAQQPPRRNNNFGMGLGAGLLGGAVGGLLIGDMISDVGGYDAGYDSGFGDGGGFDGGFGF